jgi:hypothetical protein
VFEEDKTAFIDFVRPLQSTPGPSTHPVLSGKPLALKESVRILDVTLDCRRTMDEHVSNAVARAIGKCLALRRSHDVRPAQMYQLYIVAVVPTTDYEASVWYAPLRMGVKRHFVALVRVKKLALRLILRSYKSVALLVLQSEARLQSASGRLHRRVLFHIMELCALAPDYPLQRCISWFALQGSAFSSPLRVKAIFGLYGKQLELFTGIRMNERPAWMMPSWLATKESVIYLELDAVAQLCRSLRL